MVDVFWPEVVAEGVAWPAGAIVDDGLAAEGLAVEGLAPMVEGFCVCAPVV